MVLLLLAVHRCVHLLTVVGVVDVRFASSTVVARYALEVQTQRPLRAGSMRVTWCLPGWDTIWYILYILYVYLLDL